MVQYIIYKGKKYPVRLSYRVFKGLKTDIGDSVDLSKLGEMDPVLLETMLWHGLISGHKYEEKELVFKRDEMEDILDECMFEFIQLIPLFFPKAKLGKVLPELENPKEN